MASDFIGLDENSVDQSTTQSNDSVNTTEPSSDSNIDRQPTPAHLINVHVTDGKAPIVLLFGARSSGKTMTLVRLAKYLRTKGYQLTVDMNFCTNAWEYEVNAKRFNSMLSTTKALKGTDRNDFLFIRVEDKTGTVVCQILEGAGEDYFPLKEIDGISRANIPFPAYMSHVFGGNNKKVWIFLTEPDWRVDFNDKTEYVQRIRYCKGHFTGGGDKYIILYNKVDTKGFAIDKEKVHVKNAMSACNNEYPGLFEIFKNTSANPFADKYVCKFTPFSTGIYGLPVHGQPADYTPSDDAHPANLWNTILKCIKG